MTDDFEFDGSTVIRWRGVQEHVHLPREVVLDPALTADALAALAAISACETADGESFLGLRFGWSHDRAQAALDDLVRLGFASPVDAEGGV